jgi:threonine/homoserine/homoserine lactone efflux protein
MKSLWIGWLVVVLVLGWCLVTSGGVGLYFNFPTILAIVLLSGGMSLASFGWSRLRAAVRALRSGARSPEEASEYRAVMRGVIGHVYAAGGILFSIVIVSLLRMADRPLEHPCALGVSLLLWLWCLLIAECVLRPLSNRVGRQDGGKAGTDT